MSIKIQSVTEIINKYDHFIFDMDGVIVKTLFIQLSGQVDN